MDEMRNTIKESEELLERLAKAIDETEAKVKKMKGEYVVLALMTQHAKKVLTLAELDKLTDEE